MSPFRALYPPVLIAFVGFSLATFVHPLFLLVYILGLLDFNGRAMDYAYLSEKRTLPMRLGLYYGRSYCGRQVVTTLFPVYKNVYRGEGYKWWHLLPDDFPAVVLKKDFWRTLCFGHTYGVIR